MIEKILKPSEVEKMVSDSSLRDYFAAQAMVAMINLTAAAKPEMEQWVHLAARGAYMFADAMMEAREP